MRISFLIASLLLLTLASCGSDSGSDSGPGGPAVIRQTLSGNALFYPQEHLVCRNTNAYLINTLDNIFFHMDGTFVEVDNLAFNQKLVGYPELKSVESLKVVSGTQYKFESETITKKFVDSQDEVISVEVEETEAQGTSVKICQDQTIDRKSGEHVAINVISTLSKSFQALADIGESAAMGEVEVYSHPSVAEIEQVFDNETKVMKSNKLEFMTDNAFYYNKGIYFIPHSQAYLDYIGADHVDFWEIPFIASHEYGHMVFETFFPRGTKKLSLREQARQMNCISGDWKKRHLPESFEKAERVLTKEEILGAFNEGFADMFAYYTLDSKMVSLKKVPWFEGEREVDSLIFGNGERKVYNKYVADIFFSATELGYRDAGSTFQDGHTIGAIFAANINNFMEKVGVTSQQAKLKVTIQWLKNLEKNHDLDYKLTEYAFFFRVIERFVNEVKTEIGVTSLSADQKNLLSQSFPIYDFEIRQNL